MIEACAIVALLLSSLHLLLALWHIKADRIQPAFRQVLLCLSSGLCAIAFTGVAVFA